MDTPIDPISHKRDDLTVVVRPGFAGCDIVTSMADEWLDQPEGHVFISYVREDASRVDRLAGALEDAGIRVWRDKRDLQPGQDWEIEIRRAIDNGSIAFLACFSRYSESRTRTYQNEELRLAVDQLRMRPPGVSWLIPVRFDDCQLPPFKIGSGQTLDRLQCADLFDDDSWPMLGRLIMAITRILSSQHHTPLQAEIVEPTERSESWAVSGKRALDQGRYRYGLSLVENGLKVEPLDASLQLLRSVALRGLGRATEAIEQLRLADEIEPGNKEIERELVAALVELREYQEAYRVSPDEAKRLYFDELLSGGHDGARKAYELWPDDPTAKERYRDSLIDRGINGARKAYELWPNDLIARNRLALILVEDGDLAQAGEGWGLAYDNPAVETEYIRKIVAAHKLSHRLLDTLSRNYADLSPASRSQLERMFVGQISGQVEEAKRKKYDDRTAEKLTRLIDSLGGFVAEDHSRERLEQLRKDVFFSRKDLVEWGGTVGGCFFYAVIGAAICGVFFVSWTYAGLGALVVFVVFLIGFTIYTVKEPSRRQRRLRARDPRWPHARSS